MLTHLARRRSSVPGRRAGHAGPAGSCYHQYGTGSCRRKCRIPLRHRTSAPDRRALAGKYRPGTGRLKVTLRRSRAARRLQMSAAGRLLELAFRLPDESDNAGKDRLCQVANWGYPPLMLNLQQAARFAPVMHRILHSSACRTYPGQRSSTTRSSITVGQLLQIWGSRWRSCRLCDRLSYALCAPLRRASSAPWQLVTECITRLPRDVLRQQARGFNPAPRLSSRSSSWCRVAPGPSPDPAAVSCSRWMRRTTRPGEAGPGSSPTSAQTGPRPPAVWCGEAWPMSCQA